MAPKAKASTEQNTKKQKPQQQPAKKQVQEKATSKKNKSKSTKQITNSSSACRTCCRFVIFTMFFFGLIGGLIAYDTHLHGGKFEASKTGQFLKQTGTLPYIEKGWTCTLKYSARGYKWTEANLPIYYQKTSQVVGPYVEFSKEFSIFLWKQTKKGFGNIKEYFIQKTPVVVEFIEQYAPGFPKQVGSFFSKISMYTVEAYANSCEFFKTKVFIGQLSPENLGKALNTTQQTAAQYYSWFYEKVDFYAKIK
uniref:Putative conserved plasma membrane protein n=1 Tax=Corethrella appendiculata TaxID=1370023 RepID=U5EPU1_9DIPT